MRSFLLPMSGVARLLFLKCFHQETVNSAELAVAEDADHVARLHLFAEPLDY